MIDTYDPWNEDRVAWFVETETERLYEEHDKDWIDLVNSKRKIKTLGIQFRRNVVKLPNNKDGYYLIKSVLGSPFMAKNMYYYIIGYLENGVIKCKKYRVPELILDEEFDRTDHMLGDIDLLVRNV